MSFYQFFILSKNSGYEPFVKKDTNQKNHNILLSFIIIFVAIGTVCFNERLGCLQERIESGSEAAQMITAAQEALEALQKTTFAFPWHMFWRTPLYKQFVKAKKTINE